MSRCPVCFTNFRSFLCDFTCGPKNSEYVLVKSEKPNAKDNKTAITEIDYYTTESYVTDMYNSCANVQYSASNQKITDIMFGSDEGWFKYIYIFYRPSITEIIKIFY